MLDKKQPIVIKKGGHGDHGHHGGAWKVAFADFATAMMAFFLLMWLLGSTGQEQRAGISDYFQNPAGIQGPGGASTSMIDLGGAQDLTPGDTKENKSGDEHKHDKEAKPSEQIEVEVEVERETEKKRLDSLMDELKKAMDQSQALKPFKDQLLLDITPEGLRIQIVDKENRPMFDAGSARLKHYTAQILFELSKFIDTVPNRISITGHTDASAFDRNGYTNWELSADRANTARRALVDGGMGTDKIGRVIGLASSVLFDKENPKNPVNRRISIIVMNKEADEEIMAKEAPPEYDPTQKVNEDLDAGEEFLLKELPGVPEAEPEAAAATTPAEPKATEAKAESSATAASPKPKAEEASPPAMPSTGGGIDFSKGTRIQLGPVPGQPGAEAADPAAPVEKAKPAPAPISAPEPEEPPVEEEEADEELPPLGIEFF